MGRVSKGVECSVKNCEERAVRSLSKSLVSSTELDVSPSVGKIYLCDAHWKEYKKKVKKEKKLERWRWGR